MKNVGKGLNIPLDSFGFRFDGDDILFYLEGEKNHSFSSYTRWLDEEHLTALCVNTEFKHIIDYNIQIFTLEELMKWKGL